MDEVDNLFQFHILTFECFFLDDSEGFVDAVVVFLG